jgi:hypothetical protein
MRWGALALTFLAFAVAPAAANAVELGVADDMNITYRPDEPQMMRASGFAWLRLVAYQGDPLGSTLAAAQRGRQAGLRVQVVLTPKYGEAPDGFAGWASSVSAQLATVGVERVSLLNEPDLWLPADDRCDTDTEVRQTLRGEHVSSKRVRAWVKVRARRWRWRHGHLRQRVVRVRRRRMALRITRTPTSTEHVSLTPRWGCLEIHRAQTAANVWRETIPAVRAAAPGMSILIGETSPVTGVGLFLQALPDRLPQADGWAHHPYPSSTVELGLDHAGRLGHPYGLAVYWTEFGTHVRTDQHAQPLAEARANWAQALEAADRLGVRQLVAYGYLPTGKGWDTAIGGVI